MKEGYGKQDRELTEKLLLDAVHALRDNPDKYRRFQDAFQKAGSDEERVKQLLHFATDERELAALLPARAVGTQTAAWTTVTVTTVIILESTAE